jgi:hypothetical protein
VAHGQGQQSRPTSLKLANRLDLGRSAGWPPTVDLLLKQSMGGSLAHGRPPAALPKTVAVTVLVVGQV